jgi:predicted dehydrogenase
MRLRVGLVGLGPHWEDRYRPALRVLSERFEVRGIYDQVAHKADRAAREFGCPAVDGVRALCGRDDIDAILLLDRQWIGTLPIRAAADADKAIYCATHLELNPEECAKLRDRVSTAGVSFMAELSRRHAPATVRLKELIATKLGPPRLLFAHFRRLAFKRRIAKSMPTMPSEDELALADLVEHVDWCRYVVGSEPSSVSGVTHIAPDGDGSSDYQAMTLDFSPANRPGTGALAQISCGRYILGEWEEAVHFRPPAGLQVSCERGIAFVDLPSKLIWFDEAGRHHESLDSERPLGELLLNRFYRSVTSLVHRGTNLDDTCRALQIVSSSLDSHRQGKRIRLFDEPANGAG